MPALRSSILLASACLPSAILPASASIFSKAKEEFADFLGEDGTRHASTWFHYTSPTGGASMSWFNSVTPTHSSQSTFFATNVQKFGYMGLQQVEESGLLYQGYALFSIWDAGCGAVMDESACPEDQRAKVVECGEKAVCSRFGGEGTGYKAVVHFDEWQVENSYGFLVTATQVSTTMVVYAGYFHAPELGGWHLLAKLEVGFGSHPWYVHSLGSFVEQWDDEEFADKRWAYFGPSFVEDAGAQGAWKQITSARFSWTTGATEVSSHVHAQLSPNGNQWGMGFGGDLFRSVSQNSNFQLTWQSGVPPELTAFNTLRANGQLPTGCAGGTCMKAKLKGLVEDATSKTYAPITCLCGMLAALAIGYAVCMFRAQRAASSTYTQYPQPTPFLR